ncbi:NAD(P)-binding protein [Jaminaea rosea]|uniref:NAD(P)-binding protein n=1 Tax=Jaminaea rosea TaxID=1569628 RepID=A0A316UR62_9BASI|nr:NAD(P)-binding protein [Jaminaea rosea]PWN26363.1 NAD(P)-binding protein [Jaminaea rosea]
MPAATTSSLVLRERPARGSLDVSQCFERVDSPSDSSKRLPPGHVAGKVRYIGIEPAQRNWLESSSRSYLPGVKLGEVMRSRGVGVVTESTCPELVPGDLVEGLLGWQTHFRLPAKEVRKRSLLQGDHDERHLIGLLSSTGMAAYVGTCVLLQLGERDVVLVTGAGGGVGSLAVQMAAARGAKVIATTTKAGKKRHIAGAAHVIDWSSDEARAGMQATFRSFGGLSAVVDNVGGEVLDEALLGLRPKARVILCGSSSTYGGHPTPLKNLFRVLETSASLQGFNVDDYEEHFSKAEHQMSEWLSRGQLKVSYDVRKGLNSCPEALTRLLQRQTNGKAIVSLVDEQEAEGLQWQDDTIEAQGRSICLQCCAPSGKAERTILFVCGTGFPKELWKPVAQRVQAGASSTKFIVFDMSLQGYSGLLNEGLDLPFSVDLFARDIAAVLQHLDNTHAIVVAHSIGGAAA